MRIRPWMIVAAYAGVGMVWIGLSDPLVDLLEPAPQIATYVDVAKGWAFILLTTVALYVVISRMVRSVEQSHQEAARRVTDLQKTTTSLERSEERLRDALGRAGEATWEYHAADQSVHMSPEFWNVLDMPGAPLVTTVDQWRAMIHPDDLAAMDQAIGDAFSGKADRYEMVFRLKSGDHGWRWFQSIGGLDRRAPAGAPRSVGTVRDITEMYQKDEDLRAVNAALHALIATNRAIVFAKTRQALVDTVCETLAREMRVALVWIGEALHDQARTVRPVGSAGSASDVLQSTSITWDESATGQGLVGTAIRTGKYQFSNDVSTDPRLVLWRAFYDRTGATSSMAVPIMVGGSVWGALLVHGLRSDAFGDRERDLLANLGEDIGHALESFAATERATQAEAARSHALRDLEEATINTVRALAATVEARDPYTAGHEMRVARLAVRIGERLGLTPGQLDGLLLGGSLHDIGKIGVPAEILSKPGRLHKSEMDVVREHPKIGREIVKNIRFPWPIAEMIGQHHERIDGSGYPDGLKGEQICLEARILAVADVVEAMLSHRPYRPGLAMTHAIDELRSGRGTKYWPEAVDACLDIASQPGFSILEIGGGLDRMPSVAANSSRN